VRLTDKIALITGAAAGIGEATAELFVREGASVVVADLDTTKAAEVAKRLGDKATPFTVDVSKSAAVKAMVDAAVARHGRLDILVNNAGYGIRGNVVTTEEDDWNALMAVNVNGVFLCSKHAVPHMVAQGGGVIVNIASTIALVGIRRALSGRVTTTRSWRPTTIRMGSRPGSKRAPRPIDGASRARSPPRSSGSLPTNLRSRRAAR
jgi:NAD(P)-dependent dehydrogenase (short-subunit alcohol dehydrogenase family)